VSAERSSDGRRAAAPAARRLRTHLQRLVKDLDRERTLVVASNRGPIEYRRAGGGLRPRRGAGGVVTAVSAISGIANPIWIAAAMGEGDRLKAAEAGDAAIEEAGSGYRYRLRFVAPAPEAYEWYYNVIANPLLWFLQHYLWDTPRAPNIDRETHRAWDEGYVAVNALFAAAVTDEVRRAGRPAMILLQDYHLYLAPGPIRAALPDALIQLFVHIPWPDADYWRLLPQPMREAICRSLCACDIVGFQTRRAARGFLRTCETFFPEAEVDHAAGAVRLDGRETLARAYPISVDEAAVRRTAASRAAREQGEGLADHFGEQTIVRVDRIEPSKNIVRGFEAYRLLLEEHPELHGRVHFLALLVPSRLGVEEYARYMDEVNILVGRVNLEFGDEEWQPITVIVGDNYARALAAMKRYDVLLVNPLLDGMNLVAKEGALVNERDGVLVLSEGAGAFEQLDHLSVPVSPCDIGGTADALYAALTMPAGERRERAQALRRAVEEADIARWLHDQLVDLVAVGSRRAAGGSERRLAARGQRGATHGSRAPD
jgi:trehalose 6-phosphate synthase